jgi:ABC-type phosphate transport system substrate-binding protein
MRRLLLLLSVLLLGACWAVAQDAPSQTNSNSSETSASSGQTGSATASGATTVQGCLSGSSGNFTLTDKNGNTYQLTGDTAKLSEHVCHEVKVTGTTSSSASAASGGTAGAAGANGNSQTLEVTSMKHISKTCQTGGGMSK